MQYITTYLTSAPDPQRGVKWRSDFEQLRTLIESLPKTDMLLVLHDEPLMHGGYDNIEFKLVPSLGNPYFARWEHILNNLPTYSNVCLLDATDTEILNTPPVIKKGMLYVGHEPSRVGNSWMVNNFYTDFLRNFMDEHARSQLLNCGVVSGHQSTVRRFLEHMVRFSVADVGVMEMGLFNYVMYTYFGDSFEYGNHITTQFKSYTKTGKSWIRHK